MPSGHHLPPSAYVRKTILGLSLLSLVLGGLTLAAGPAAATPWTGPEPTPTNLLFFAHNSSTGITVGTVQYLDVLSTVNDTRAPWAPTGARTVSTHYLSASFVVAPQFQSPLVLNGTVDATAYLNQSGSSPTGGSITVRISEVAPNGNLTVLGTGPATGTSAIGPGGSIPSSVFLAGPTLRATVPAGDSLQATITVSGNTAEGYGLWWGLVNGTYYATSVSVPVSTYLSVSPVAVLNATGVPTSVLPVTTGNEVATIQGVVSDPLGAYDFENFSVDFSVVSPTGTVVVPPTPMTPVGGLAAPSAANAMYELAFNYSVLPAGSYNFTVNATDNTNHNLAGQDTLPAYFGRNAFGWVPVTIGLPPVAVTLTVVDDRNATLPGALVQVLSGGTVVANGRTNGSGELTLNLAGGALYAFAVYWQGIPVGSFDRVVGTTSTAFTLEAQVIYPTFEIRAADGQPLPYPLVTLIHPNGTGFPLIVANGTGVFALQQVPAGNYTFTVVYDDSEVVFAEIVPATSDGPIVVTAQNVFPLVVSTTTSSAGALPGVFISVVNATTGATVASGVTGGSGSLTFLVPAGTYTVSGDWVATYDLTGLQQTVTTTVSVTGPSTTALKFTQAYPSFFSTTLFALSAVVALLVAVAVVLGVLWLRARRRRPPAPPAASTGPKT